MPTTIHSAVTSIRPFLRDEAGTISVDWVVISALVATMSLATAGVLVTSTSAFENHVEYTLKYDVSNVQAVSGSAGDRSVGDGSGDDSEEFGFAAISNVASTSSARVTCGTLVTSCAQAAEIVSHQFVMTDGSIWTRTVTSYSDGSGQSVAWLDDTGRETTDVPELPADIPSITLP